jgi:dihydrofolate synthase/folylpolyglutamate synthase
VKELPHRKTIAVLSISSDKNIPEMIKSISIVVDRFIVTLHGVMGRAARPKIITDSIGVIGKPYEVVEKVGDALDRALELAGKDDMVLVTGSVFLVGEARHRWIGVPS